MTNNPAGSVYQLNETSFHLLMKTRIHKVLLISSTYDAFILEEDGRIDEQIFNEYVSLSLRYPPIFIQATSAEEAFEILETDQIDLVISMLSIDDMDPFEFSKKIKDRYVDIPIVVLTPFSREVSIKLENEDLSAIDYVFSWLGNADLLLAIIKLIEDKMNMEHDVDVIGVQTLILVEDSIRFYSSYLPQLYKIIFKQSKEFMTEGLNEHQKMLRMRGRPKVILARNYEEAIRFYERFKHNLLGIISDISYHRGKEVDKLAGVRLCKKVKSEDQYLPFLLQSSEIENAKYAKEQNVKFLYKGSNTLDIELREYVNEYLAFGKFVFLDPKNMSEIASSPDLNSLQHKIMEVPDECFLYHIERNHFSKWLNARALFPIAEKIKYLTTGDFQNLDEIRRYIFDTIANYRLNKGRGVIAEFDRFRFDEYTIFSRIGNGSIGGKARGLAFIDSMIKKNNIMSMWENVVITIPKTVVLTTDIFDEFMEDNHLYQIALSKLEDEEILTHFINSRLPFRIHEDLLAFISVVNNPIAVRSSSLLEDSHYQPFAGVYSTYMVPNNHEDENALLSQLGNAIKSVYASVFFKSSKAYMKATKNVIDSEKMGIILQEVCGTKYEDHFYPSLSGVARSINFYPIEPEKAEDGVATIAMGLGKHIVDGGISLRFSPAYPQKIIQLSNVKSALKETQKYFYALDLKNESFKPSIDDSINLIKKSVKEAEKDGALKMIASTYDFENEMLRDGTSQPGKRVITFAQILKHNVFPLADIVKTLLEVGSREMNKPIEIEFAVNLNAPKGKPRVFNFLQIRPIVETDESIDFNLNEINNKDCIIRCESALGNGKVTDLYDIVYVKPTSFDAAKTKEIAQSVEEINEKFVAEDKNYVLIGPGRWGSSDPWLGIPVSWSQISQARLIVESGLENYRIDPSQGTHFFQNLTSFRVGYFTINPYIKDGYFDLEHLNKQEALFENEFIRHIHFQKSVNIYIDGKSSKGVVLKEGLDILERL
jgi:CheY-like chemotaxis protein